MQTISSEKRAKYEEIIKNFRLIDDYFMRIVFDDDPEATAYLLNVFFDRDDMVVTKVKSEEEYKNPNGRSVRFDIHAIDSDGKHYDIEMQRQNKGADVRRARFNSSMLDSRMLEAGQDTDEIADSYVIFITEHDVRGKGKAMYDYVRKESGSNDELDDGSHIIYVNGAYRSEDDRIGRLMHDFRCRSADEMHDSVLAKRVRYFKEAEGGSDKMCEAMEKLILEDRMEKSIRNVINLYNLGVSLDTISDGLELSIEEVKRILQSETAK